MPTEKPVKTTISVTEDRLVQLHQVKAVLETRAERRLSVDETVGWLLKLAEVHLPMFSAKGSAL